MSQVTISSSSRWVSATPSARSTGGAGAAAGSGTTNTFAHPGVRRTGISGDDGSMTEGMGEGTQRPDGLRIVTLGPDGSPTEVDTGVAAEGTDDDGTSLTDMV